MDHAEVEPLLKDYFAGRLGRETVRALHAHFKGCEDCRARMRLKRVVLERGKGADERGLASPEIQTQIARNRNLLIQILALLIFAWFVWKIKR